MASHSQEDVRWELDTNDIASIASDDLYENRPNRWKGPRSTWRYHTRQERQLWRSMNTLQDRDLAIHLYNAHALKKRARRNNNKDLAADPDDEQGQDGSWAPPKAWSAWPVHHELLPEEPFIKDNDDGCEDWTVRMSVTRNPSSDLHEELGAQILRLAKQRILNRQARWAEADLSPSASNVEEKDEQVADSIEPETIPQTEPGPSFGTEYQRPEVCADDEQSSRLLLQPIRHILSKLDDTLTVLHNMRQAHGRRRNSGSTTSASESERNRSRSASARRGRGRPREMPLRQKDDPTAIPKLPTDRRGRPRNVHTPRDGETQQQMALRVAREGHRRLPTTQKERDEALLSASRELLTEEEMEERYEAWLRSDAGGASDVSDTNQAQDADDETDGNAQALKHKVIPSSPLPLVETQVKRLSVRQREETSARVRQRNSARLGLRDWSDVLGAAALAGFPETVISRAAQRCADLFGEGMTFHRLNEMPVKDGTGVQESIYRPQPIKLSYEDDDVFISDEEVEHEPARSVSTENDPSGRQSSFRASTPRRASKSRSRSRSVTSSPGFFYCPVHHCPRATEGFGRRNNLKRHVELVHPQFQDSADVDSEDEVAGGVHRDGFLKRIVPGKGWRGEDKNERKRKKTWGKKDVVPRINVSGQRSRALSVTDDDSGSH